MATIIDGEFKSYTELNRVALLKKQAHILRVWYLLKHLDTQGSSWFRKGAFLKAIQGMGLSLRRAEQIYNQGLNVYWSKAGNDGSIRLTSKYHLARQLGVYLGDIVQLPIEFLFNLEKSKAVFYASFFARDSWKVVDNRINPMGGKTISREWIVKNFGICVKTQKAYERIANVKVTPQYAYASVDQSNAEYIPMRNGDLETSHNGTWVEDINNDGQDEVIWQIPNSYNVNLHYVGNAKRRMKRKGGLDKRDEAEPRNKIRLYYPNFRSGYTAIKSHNNSSKGVYVPGRAKQNIYIKTKGGRLYEFITPA